MYNSEYSRSELYHHGRLGQKWGVRNGPPYPLSGGQMTSEYKQNGGVSKSAEVAYGGKKYSKKSPIKKFLKKAKKELTNKENLKNMAVSATKAAVKGAILGPWAASASIAYDIGTGKFVGGKKAEEQTFNNLVENSSKYLNKGKEFISNLPKDVLSSKLGKLSNEIIDKSLNGAGVDEIQKTLKKAGWTDEAIKEAGYTKEKKGYIDGKYYPEMSALEDYAKQMKSTIDRDTLGKMVLDLKNGKNIDIHDEIDKQSPPEKVMKKRAEFLDGACTEAVLEGWSRKGFDKEVVDYLSSYAKEVNSKIDKGRIDELAKKIADQTYKYKDEYDSVTGKRLITKSMKEILDNSDQSAKSNSKKYGNDDEEFGGHSYMFGTHELEAKSVGSTISRKKLLELDEEFKKAHGVEAINAVNEKIRRAIHESADPVLLKKDFSDTMKEGALSVYNEIYEDGYTKDAYKNDLKKDLYEYSSHIHSTIPHSKLDSAISKIADSVYSSNFNEKAVNKLIDDIYNEIYDNGYKKFNSLKSFAQRAKSDMDDSSLRRLALKYDNNDTEKGFVEAAREITKHGSVKAVRSDFENFLNEGVVSIFLAGGDKTETSKAVASQLEVYAQIVGSKVNSSKIKKLSNDIVDKAWADDTGDPFERGIDVEEVSKTIGNAMKELTGNRSAKYGYSFLKSAGDRGKGMSDLWGPRPEKNTQGKTENGGFLDNIKNDIASAGRDIANTVTGNGTRDTYQKDVRTSEDLSVGLGSPSSYDMSWTKGDLSKQYYKYRKNAKMSSEDFKKAADIIVRNAAKTGDLTKAQKEFEAAVFDGKMPKESKNVTRQFIRERGDDVGSRMMERIINNVDGYTRPREDTEKYIKQRLTEYAKDINSDISQSRINRWVKDIADGAYDESGTDYEAISLGIMDALSDISKDDDYTYKLDW